MRILHVNKFLYRRGGAEGYLFDLAAAQRAGGDEVEFFGMADPDNLPMRFAEHFPPYARFDPAPAHLTERLGLAGRMLWSPAAARGMAAVLAAYRPDIVHLHNIYHQLSPSVIAATRRARVPMVMTVHDYKLVCPTYRFLDHGHVCTACLDGGLRQAPRRRCQDGSLAASSMAALEVGTHRLFGAYAAVGAFACPSRFLRDRLAEGHVATDRLVHLPNGTPVDVPVRIGAGEGILYAGRLSPEKGVDVLLHAVARLPQARLEIAGDGPDRAALTGLATRVAPGRVRFHGRLEPAALQALTARARVTALPARWLENQPLAVLESYAAQVPVVASALGGIPELVDASTGTLVGPDDPAALAAALGRYLDDPEMAVAHGLGGRARVLRDHAPEVHLRRVANLYSDVRIAHAAGSAA